MTGLFSTLNTANKGLFAQQTSLHTASHNIANTNTKGYTRQRVEMKADIAYNLVGVGQLGTGVRMDSIVRLVDDYTVKQIRNEIGTLERYTAKSELTNQLEVIFNEPSTSGLNFYLGEMFDSWQELSKNPESLTSKTIVVEKSKSLADIINHMNTQIHSLKDETIGQLEKNALDFNSIVDKLESLNQQILNISLTEQIPNDLLDQRDLMLEDLGTITNFKTSHDKYGRVSIKCGDINILGGEEQLFELSLVTDIVENIDGDGNLIDYTVFISQGGNGLNGSVEINVDDIGDFEIGKAIFTKRDGDIESLDDIEINDSISSGRIKGYREALQDIDNSIISIDDFANTLVKAVNIIHTDGNGAGNIGGVDYYDFFTIIEENGGLSIKVNDDIQDDNSRVWVGRYPDSPEGDGSRALMIAGLRNTKMSFKGHALDYDLATMSIKNFTGGMTIEGAYGNIVTNIGISKEHSDNIIANQEILVGQLEMRRESVSGVSIDEEISNVIKYQKAYEANARVIQTLSEMLDVLINRTGV